MLEKEVSNLFWNAKEEYFEDGVETAFSKKLVEIVKNHGNNAIEIIEDLTINNKVNAEVASEALRWLGNLEHQESYNSRRSLLEKSLKNSSPRIRDGAILGLSYMDNIHAIPYLEEAIKTEECAELKEDMQQVLTYLKTKMPTVVSCNYFPSMI